MIFTPGVMCARIASTFRRSAVRSITARVGRISGLHVKVARTTPNIRFMAERNNGSPAEDSPLRKGLSLEETLRPLEAEDETFWGESNHAGGVIGAGGVRKRSLSSALPGNADLVECDF